MVRSSFRLALSSLLVGSLAAGSLVSCGGDSGGGTGTGGRGGLGGSAAGGRGGAGAGGITPGGGGAGGAASGGIGGSHSGGAGGAVPGTGGIGGGGGRGSGGSGSGGTSTGGVGGSAPGTGGAATGGHGTTGSGGQGGTAVGGGGVAGAASSGGATGGGGTGHGGSGAAGSGPGGIGGAAGGPGSGGAAGSPGTGGAAGSSGAGGSTVVSCAGTSMAPGRVVLWGPQRGAYSGSFMADPALMTLRPTFVWHAPAGCTAETYEIQIDDSCLPGQIATCAFPTPEVSTSVPVSTTRFTPATPLGVQTIVPVGAVYSWRVRACAGAAGCGAWSEVGYVNVGRVTNDINGDGYAELLAESTEGTNRTKRVEIYPGGIMPGMNAPVHLGGGPLGGVDYTSPLFLGDVNGDGFADFMCRHTDPSTFFVTQYIFLGGPDLAALSRISFSGDSPNHFSIFADAGDFNGDGFSDVLQDDDNRVSTEAMAFYIYLGAAAFGAKVPELRAEGPLTGSTPLMQRDVSQSVGDINGDGFSDVALIHTANNQTTSLVRLVLGSSAPDAVGDGDVSVPFGPVRDPAGDIDGDGYDDVVWNSGGYGILRGGPTLPSSFTLIDASHVVSLAGFDINSDGWTDLLLSATNGLILGGPTPTLAAGLTALSTDSTSRYLTWADYNGDGRPDFADGDFTTHAVFLLLNDGTLNPVATPLAMPPVSPYALDGYIAYGR